MVSKSSRIRLIFAIALIIGGIGAVGQAYLLNHQLVDCLPYKETGFGLYQTVAIIGVWVAPLTAIFTGCLLGLRRFWLATSVPVFLCPLLFAGIFKTISVIRESGDALIVDDSFESITRIMAAQDFYYHAVSLAVVGLMVGGIYLFLLSRFLPSKKFA